VTNTDPLSIGERILGDKGKCAAWLGMIVSGRNADLWNGLVERDPNFVKLVWEQVFGVGRLDFELKFWTASSRGIRIVSPCAWSFSKELHPWDGDAETSGLSQSNHY